VATLNTLDRRALSGSGAAEPHAKSLLDSIDAIIGEVNARRTKVLGPYTADGLEQSIEHGLGRIPTGVAPCIVYNPDSNYAAGSEAFSLALGTHTATHVKVTSTSGIQYYLVVTGETA